MLDDHRRKATSLEGYRGHSRTAATPDRRGHPLNVSLPLGVKEFFPTMWSDDVTEQGFVTSTGQPVHAAVLMIGPAGRQIIEAGHLVIDDCAVADRWPNDAIASSTQQIDQILELFLGDDRHVTFGLRHLSICQIDKS